MDKLKAEPVKPLEFDRDAGSSRSKWLAGFLVLALIVWMGSGFLLPADKPLTDIDTPEPAPIAVAVIDSQAEEITEYFTAEGQSVPDRETVVRAKTEGVIAELFVTKGARVEAGSTIARFDPAERDALLLLARAERDRTKRDYENAQKLLDRGVATGDRLAEARASYAGAEAQLATIEAQLSDTQILAPFAGLLDDLDIDVGEYVSTGAAVARIIDTDPLTIEVRVPQQMVANIAAGQAAELNFITGQTRDGTVSYVSGSADAETRTFRAEITVPNADSAIPAGISVQLRLAIGTSQAHFISPAILSLGSDGILGVKTVEAENRVAFHAVNILRAETAGIWVTGLPDKARIITVGQGFVSTGEVVAPSLTLEATATK